MVNYIKYLLKITFVNFCFNETISAMLCHDQLVYINMAYPAGGAALPLDRQHHDWLLQMINNHKNKAVMDFVQTKADVQANILACTGTLRHSAAY